MGGLLGEGAKGMLPPPSQIIGAPAPPPLPTPMILTHACHVCDFRFSNEISSIHVSEHNDFKI